MDFPTAIIEKPAAHRKSRAISLAAGLALVPMLWSALEIARAVSLNWKGMSYLGAVGAIALLWRWLRAAPRGWFLGALLLGAAAVRIAWIAVARTEPVSDFASYHDFARAFAEGESGSALFARVYTQELGYPLVLGVLFRITGPGMAAAWALNVAAAVALIAVAYEFGRRAFDERGGRIVALILALSPGLVAMSSVLASEHLYTPLVWLGVLLVVAGVQSGGAKVQLAGGLVLGLSNAVRATSLAALLGCLAFALLRRSGGQGRWRAAGAIALGFAVAMAGYSAWRLAGGDKPGRSALGASLLFGSNAGSEGGWNPDDSALFGRLVEQHGFEGAQLEAAKIAVPRWMGGLDSVRLVVRKIGRMWGDGRFGSSWATPWEEREPPLRSRLRRAAESAEQTYQVGLLALALLGCALALRRRGGLDAFTVGATVVLLMLLGLHAVMEAQPRYQMPWILPLALLAARAVEAPLKGTSPQAPANSKT